MTLRHPHYDTVLLENQTLSDGEVLRIACALVQATGKLTVLTEPPGAWIERDGTRLAEGTPVTLDGLPAGRAELTLGALEYETIRVLADIPKDGVGTLERTLRRIPHGTLTLELDPSDATVTLPDIEPAYRAGMRLPEGEHRVTARRPGYREVTQTVVVSGDTRTRIALVLNQPGETFSDALASGGAGPEMVVVPEGSFRMGCVSGRDCEDDEHPVHEVTIPQPFALSVYEVTFADWEACANAGGCSRYRPHDPGWGRGNRPVINVSWEEAQSYVSWLSRETGEVYRLPSESEWEYAARAGTATSYS